jgi:Xaa-Pro dipeptidase
MLRKTDVSVEPTSPALMDLDRARRLMDEAGLDVLVASSERNVYYTSEFPCFDYIVDPRIVTYSIIPARADAEAFLVIPISVALTLEYRPTWIPNKVYFGGYYVKGVPPMPGTKVEDPTEGLVHALGELGLRRGRIGLELQLLPASTYHEIQRALPDAELLDGYPVLRQLRTIKSAEEITRLRRACQVTEWAIREAFQTSRPGMTERQVEQRIRHLMIDAGCVALYVQAGTKGRGAYGAVYPTDVVIEKGDAVRVDASAIYDHYVADMCRVCVVGDEPTVEQKEYYEISLQAVHAAIDLIRPGARIPDLVKAAMQVPINLGHPNFKRHHVGHGIGLQIHEWPYLMLTNDQTLEANMVLAVEVPYYVYGLGGFAPEDNVLVTEDGYEYLHPPVPEIMSF